MSQVIYDTINPQTTSGTQLAQILNDFKDAVVTGFMGPTRPPNLKPGGYWINNTQLVTSNVLDYMFWTGVTDVRIFRVNLATGSTEITGSDNSFEIDRISEDTIGPMLKLLKRRVTGAGQVKLGDVLGEIQFMGTTNETVSPVSVRIRAVAAQDFTNLDQGASLIFELVKPGGTLLEEAFRILNGNLGLGTINPTERLHLMGNMKAERVEDSINPASSILRKRRVSGNGQVLANDIISRNLYQSTDNNGNSIDVGKIEVVATENHTGAAQGTKMDFYTKKIGTAVFFKQFTLDDAGIQLDNIFSNGNFAQSVFVDNTSTGIDFLLPHPGKTIILLKNVGLESISGITLGTQGKWAILTNDTDSDIVLKNNSAVVPANGILTGTGDNLELAVGASVIAFYETSSNRWRLMGGSGGGGGSKKVMGSMAEPILIDDTGIDFTGSQGTLMLFVQGALAGDTVEITANPQISPGNKVGQELILYFTSSTDLVQIDSGNGAAMKGAFLSDLDSVLKLIWNGVYWVDNGRN